MSNKIKKKQLKQIENQAQQGRSMVEMLGVLAIVGVLSIGGIAGYRWGMDKHVSNQILNEMNLNSLQLAMLLQKGNPDGVTLALGSPYDDENPTFSTVNYGFDYGCGEGESDEIDFHKCRYIDETRYYIEAYNLPERVAKMVVDAAAGLQYYDGYDEAESQSGENQKDVTVFFDVDPTVEAGIPRPEETEPHYTPMPEVTEPTTTTTTVTTTSETTTTEATTTTTTVTTTTVTTTTERSDPCEELHCDPDKYCDMDVNANDCLNGAGFTLNISDNSNRNHQCRSVDDYKEKTITLTDGSTRTFYKSKGSMDWWAADAFCKALGNKLNKPTMHLVKVSDLRCQPTGNNGCADSEIRQKLYTEGEKWTNAIWATTKGGINPKSCSADSYFVSLSGTTVGSGQRFNTRDALCIVD